MVNRIGKCPYCGESYYYENYQLSTANYTPVVYRDGVPFQAHTNNVSHFCTCVVCGNTFSYVTKGEEISYD